MTIAITITESTIISYPLIIIMRGSSAVSIA